MNELIYQKLYTDTSFHENGIIFADHFWDETAKRRQIQTFFAVACVDYITLIKNCICSHELQQCTAFNKKISLGHGTRRCVRNLP